MRWSGCKICGFPPIVLCFYNSELISSIRCAKPACPVQTFYYSGKITIEEVNKQWNTEQKKKVDDVD